MDKSTWKTRKSKNPGDSLHSGARQGALRLLRYATALRVTPPHLLRLKALVWPKGSLPARPHGPEPPFFRGALSSSQISAVRHGEGRLPGDKSTGMRGTVWNKEMLHLLAGPCRTPSLSLRQKTCGHLRHENHPRSGPLIQGR